MNQAVHSHYIHIAVLLAEWFDLLYTMQALQSASDSFARLMYTSLANVNWISAWKMVQECITEWSVMHTVKVIFLAPCQTVVAVNWVRGVLICQVTDWRGALCEAHLKVASENTVGTECRWSGNTGNICFCSDIPRILILSQSDRIYVLKCNWNNIYIKKRLFKTIKLHKPLIALALPPVRTVCVY